MLVLWLCVWCLPPLPQAEFEMVLTDNTLPSDTLPSALRVT
jgi:hypothetical protein